MRWPLRGTKLDEACLPWYKPGTAVARAPSAAERVKQQYVLEDSGEHRLKNVSEPVRVFRLVPPGMYARVTV